MEKGVNVFTEDAKEQAEFSFVGDIKEASPTYLLICYLLLISFSSTLSGTWILPLWPTLT
jgi:hypothetical protein